MSMGEYSIVTICGRDMSSSVLYKQHILNCIQTHFINSFIYLENCFICQRPPASTTTWFIAVVGRKNEGELSFLDACDDSACACAAAAAVALIGRLRFDWRARLPCQLPREPRCRRLMIPTTKCGSYCVKATSSLKFLIITVKIYSILEHTRTYFCIELSMLTFTN